MTTVRAPAVAGRFYPAGSRDLAGVVDSLLDVAPAADGGAAPAAYVVPHAGYRFSGPTAARAYARLRRYAEPVRRVVLVGPAHYATQAGAPLAGCAAPEADRWATPLGEVPLDTEAARALAAAGLVTLDDRPHAPEHSLEVQVPFLQRVLAPGVPLLPVAVGRTSAEDVAALLAAAVDGPGTVVLCSTDLSHYLDRETAEARDARTVRAVLDLADDRIGGRDACGAYPLRGLVAWARAAGLRAELLHRCTSADTAGDPARVVGYAAFAFA
ncbi:MAG TPA: AmmeMemoRadiSam system protein B [Micromonosporaceae bacterium]|nr:AmmeMemoRadiSam system protein B [Micromonosporaceae bacterium]